MFGIENGFKDNRVLSLLCGVGLTFICALFTLVGAVISVVNLSINGKGNVQKTKKIWVGSFGLSAGILLYMSLASLLPEGYELFKKSKYLNKLENVPYIVMSSFLPPLFFLCGVMFIAGINKLLTIFDMYPSCGCVKDEVYNGLSPQSISVKYIPNKDNTHTAIENENNENLENSHLNKDPSSIRREADFYRNEKTSQNTINGCYTDIDSEIDSIFNRKAIKINSIEMTIALAFHHLPEGLAIVIAAKEDFLWGTIMAIGLGIHYLPEAMTIAIPMYISTKGRGVYICIYTTLVLGFSCTLGAILSIPFLMYTGDGLFSGFGLIATSGVLFYITLYSLLIPSIVMDKSNKIVGKAALAGIVIMALAANIMDPLERAFKS